MTDSNFSAGFITEGREWRGHDQFCQERRMGLDRLVPQK